MEPRVHSSDDSQHRRQLTLDTDWMSATFAAIGLLLFPLLLLNSISNLQRGRVTPLLTGAGLRDYVMEAGIPVVVIVFVLLAWRVLERRHKVLLGAFLTALLLKGALVLFALPEDVRWVIWVTQSILWVAIWSGWTVGIIFWIRSVVRYV